MSLQARASAIRGDDYQHVIGWYWACQMLRDPDIASVAIEDPSGGAFDDIVICRRTNPDTYIQVKSSTSGNTIIDLAWLMKAATQNGRSPLQHFYDTYAQLVKGGEEVVLEFWTNRGYDHRSRVFGKLFDKKHEKVRTDQLLAARKRSKAHRERTALATHLEVDGPTLAAFLDKVRWKTTGAEPEWRRQAKPLMELAGLRSDDQAVDSGVSLVRSWVTDGSGAQSIDDVRAAVAKRDLLVTSGTLVMAVHGNDREVLAVAPTVELDFVHLYDGDDSFTRKLLLDRGDWSKNILPALSDAVRALEGYRVRNVHVIGSLRHPMWFVVGRSLPEVKKWTLAVEQVGATWRTDEESEDVEARVLSDVDLGAGEGVAVALGLSGDPTEAVRQFLESADIDVGRLLVFGPEGQPSRASVPSGGWAMNWARSVREQTRVGAPNAQHIHLFMQCPGGVALMLGHQWNVMPDTTIYEYAGESYHPTVTLPGR